MTRHTLARSVSLACNDQAVAAHPFAPSRRSRRASDASPAGVRVEPQHRAADEYGMIAGNRQYLRGITRVGGLLGAASDHVLLVGRPVHPVHSAVIQPLHPSPSQPAPDRHALPMDGGQQRPPRGPLHVRLRPKRPPARPRCVPPISSQRLLHRLLTHGTTSERNTACYGSVCRGGG